MAIFVLDLFYAIGSSDSFALEDTLVHLDWSRNINRIDFNYLGVLPNDFVVLHHCDELLQTYLVAVADYIYAVEGLDCSRDGYFIFEDFIFIE